jgi:hypothetical protein
MDATRYLRLITCLRKVLAHQLDKYTDGGRQKAVGGRWTRHCNEVDGDA